jgi:hypothetical protein
MTCDHSQLVRQHRDGTSRQQQQRSRLTVMEPVSVPACLIAPNQEFVGPLRELESSVGRHKRFKILQMCGNQGWHASNTPTTRRSTPVSVLSASPNHP